MKSAKSIESSHPRRSSNKFRFGWVWIYFIVLSYAIISPFFEPSEITGKETTWQQFQSTMLNRRAVEKLEVINNERVEVYIRKSFAGDKAFKDVFKPLLGDSINNGPHFYFIIGSVESFERKMEQAEMDMPIGQRIPVTYNYNRGTGFWSMVRWLVPFILIFFFLRYLVLRSRRRRNKGYAILSSEKPLILIENENSKVTVVDVGGEEVPGANV